ncbi:hypothetical protein B0T22DRAFT_14295 [Podospora appendiculata]|uniref:Uncharacterized protein n=1 Tax=Podospora appendiculata TaxID=314037 RepID=A0AAE1CFJ5_9PEZI|nr:hypothetical protein B0T22DRAFT_14295 [Podospora appendiculata]
MFGFTTSPIERFPHSVKKIDLSNHQHPTIHWVSDVLEDWTPSGAWRALSKQPAPFPSHCPIPPLRKSGLDDRQFTGEGGYMKYRISTPPLPGYARDYRHGLLDPTVGPGTKSGVWSGDARQEAEHQPPEPRLNYSLYILRAGPAVRALNTPRCILLSCFSICYLPDFPPRAPAPRYPNLSAPFPNPKPNKTKQNNTIPSRTTSSSTPTNRMTNPLATPSNPNQHTDQAIL